MAKKTVTKKSPAKKPVKKTGTKTAKKTAKKAPTKESAAKKDASATKTKKAAKKRTRKAAKAIRLKAYWGVFNQSLRRVALFDFNEKKQADKKAQDLSKSGKSPHFVQPVKEVIEDA
jgi:hypothetical protein